MILVGPSGCGKSTALNMIAGLEDITSGELRIGGEVVNKKAPRDRDIAMVFQSYALYPHMTVRDNIAFALKLAKRPKEEIDAKVKEAADILDLGQHLERKPANLSGGQRQRVAMGRAIVRNPKAFLMDEPLSNLDAKLRVQMRAEVARIQTAHEHHHGLRHPRSDRGHDAGRPRGHHAARRAPAGRVADGALQHPEQPVRGRLHRLAGHELPAGVDRRRRGEAADGVGEAPEGGARPRRARRSQAQADRRHPARGLRGRRAGGRRRQGPGHDVQDEVRPRRGDGRRVLRALRRQGRCAAVLVADGRAAGGAGRRHRGHGRGRKRRRRAPRRREQRQGRRRRPSSGSTRRRCTSSTPTPASRSPARRTAAAPRPGPGRGAALACPEPRSVDFATGPT